MDRIDVLMMLYVIYIGEPPHFTNGIEKIEFCKANEKRIIEAYKNKNNPNPHRAPSAD